MWKKYVDKVIVVSLKIIIIDQNKVFRHRFYQEDCHLFINNEQEVIEYLKDINLFHNRSLKKKIIFDNKA